MNPQKQELLEKVKAANNILVTVSSNPSVDQLAACIGLTLLLNKLKKHATAVFSGEVPSTIEFLKPEETLEKNTDSLRDFIISLDKGKADKLRYKVEDQVVRIFITPYRTSISQDDLDFSQGDFNVDLVLCLGVSNQQDLDQAITTHGRILHDAVVATLSTQEGGELGTINWVEPTASSLSELVAELADALGKELMDGQIATAVLTGIVAETDRFSNEKTSPETMRLSAELMAAGANQQLVANELESPSATAISVSDGDVAPAGNAGDGTLEIAHNGGAPTPGTEDENLELPTPQEPAEPVDDLTPDELPSLDTLAPLPSEAPADTPEPAATSEINPAPTSRLMLQPPALGGTLTANSMPEETSLQDPLSMNVPNPQPLLDHDSPAAQLDTPSEPVNEPAPADEAPQPAEPEPMPLSEPSAVISPTPPPGDTDDDDQIQIDPNGNLTLPTAPPEPVNQPLTPVSSSDDNKTLTDLEAAVKSPHLEAETGEEGAPAAGTDSAGGEQAVDAARDAVQSAIAGAPATGPIEPTAASGATGYLDVQDLPDTNDEPVLATPPADLTEAAANGSAVEPSTQPLPPVQSPVAEPPADTNSEAKNDAPPPVPPPLPLDDLSKFSTPQK